MSHTIEALKRGALPNCFIPASHHHCAMLVKFSSSYWIGWNEMRGLVPARSSCNIQHNNNGGEWRRRMDRWPHDSAKSANRERSMKFGVLCFAVILVASTTAPAVDPESVP